MQEVLNNVPTNGHDLPPNHRRPREYTLNEIEIRDLIYNATSRDTRGLRKLMQEKRDYDNECDYPAELTVNDHYKFYFDYHAVATRTVEVLPLETWQVQPSVYEDDDPNVKTEFEKAWDELGSNLRGQSWHKKEEGSPVWEYLKRADILSGIGSFGVILLGFDDNQPLNTPVAMLAEEDDDEEDTWDVSDTDEESGDDTGSDSNSKVPTNNAVGSVDAQYDGSVFGTDKVPKLKEGTKRKLIFMRPFDETLVQVTRLETDVASPRHNQPIMYRLTLIDPDFAKEHNIAMNIACPEVHWTRILHIADNLTNSECFGVPRQQPVYRHLRNLYKLYGGAPEMYWRGAMNGLSFETHPQLGGDVDVDKDAFKDMIENFRNGLQRDLQTSGMTVKSIAPNVSDPTPFIDGQITAICIKLGIPQRIFMGSERGELASSQDDSSWNDRLKHRQEMYVTPRIIIPFIDRMIATGVLPKPSGKLVESNLTEDNPSLQEDNASEVEFATFDDIKEGKKGFSKPTANAFGNPSSSSPNATSGGKPGFPPKTSGNAPKASVGASSGGDNVGTGPEAGVPAAPKARVLPEKDSEPGYCITWPDLDSMTEAQKAQIALQKTQALMAFIAGNGESAMTLVDFYTKVLYMTDEEAIGVITAVNKQIEDDERLTPDPEEARQDEMDMQGEQFDKELEAKKELAESGQGFQAEMFDKQSAVDEKMAKLKPKGKPVANFNPNQPRDATGKWSSGGAISPGGQLARGTTVLFHEGENKGYAVTLDSVIQKRYSAEATTYRGQIEGIKGGAGNVIVTHETLVKQATLGVQAKPSEVLPKASQLTPEDHAIVALGRAYGEKHFGGETGYKEHSIKIGYPVDQSQEMLSKATTAQQRIKIRNTAEYKKAQEEHANAATKWQQEVMDKSIGAKVEGKLGEGVISEWVVDAYGGKAVKIKKSEGDATNYNMVQFPQFWKVSQPKLPTTNKLSALEKAKLIANRKVG